jgi:hypothetical protein
MKTLDFVVVENCLVPGTDIESDSYFAVEKDGNGNEVGRTCLGFDYYLSLARFENLEIDLRNGLG